MPRKGDEALLEDRERLRHMLLAAKDAAFFASGRDRAELDSDRMFMRAVLHAIQEIGEAAARTTEAGRRRVPGIPWGAVVQMRHILVHAYFNVNLDYVWQVLEKDLPPMLAALERALDNWPKSS